jgi:cell division protein FtsN
LATALAHCEDCLEERNNNPFSIFASCTIKEGVKIGLIIFTILLILTVSGILLYPTIFSPKNEPFEETKTGTYAILPPEEPIDIEQELEKMSRQKKTPVKPWTAMQDFGRRNERNIRESIERVDREERKNQDINEQVRQLLGISNDQEPSYDLAARTPQQAKKPAAKIKPPTPPPPPPPPKTFYKSDIKKAEEKKAAENKATEKKL